MALFLVVYTRSTGAVFVQEFEDPSDAMSARMEYESIASADTEVVVLSSGSRHDLYRTHSRYFQNSAEILRDSGESLGRDLTSA